jgi:hypothetical protein
MSMFPIASQTGNGSATNITFSSIPTGFTHLQVRCYLRGVRSFSAEQVYIRLNGDTGNNYAYHYMNGNGSSTDTSGVASTNVILTHEMPAANETANIYSVIITDILDWQDTNKNKTIRSLSGYDNNANTGLISSKVWFSSGLRINTAAITSVTILSNGAFTSASRFDLYGISTSNVTGA